MLKENVVCRRQIKPVSTFKGNNERCKGAKIQRKTAIKRGPAGNKDLWMLFFKIFFI
jgi:hypothetical protein